MSPADIVNKLWNYCNVLRDDGMSYGDYVEQLTYLLFLKMSDERTKDPYNKPSVVPAGYDWLVRPHRTHRTFLLFYNRTSGPGDSRKASPKIS